MTGGSWGEYNPCTDLYQLRYFLEVARELSFTRAAANLNISPPAVSRSVALLEASVRRRLFSRTRRRVALTADGELLKARAERIFDEIERARLELGGEGAPAPSMLRVGSREMITNYLFPRALREFAARFPQTRFGLHELGPRELADSLKKDLVDFGFYYSEIPDPALEARHLGRLRSHIYAAKPLLPKGGGRDFRKALGLPFVAPRYFQADPAQPSVDGFPDQEHPRHIRYEAEFLETHRRFVLDGLAVAVLPDIVIREERKAGRVVQLSGPPIYREIYFFKRRGRPLHPSVEVLLGFLRKTIRGLS